MLHPVISTAAIEAGPVVDVTTDVTIGTRQRVDLALLNPATGERRFLIRGPARSADATTVSFPIDGVAAGSYAVQVFVDGADSIVVRNNAGVITAPLVAVP